MAEPKAYEPEKPFEYCSLYVSNGSPVIWIFTFSPLASTCLNNSTGCLERCEGDQNYKLGLHHEATPETRQQLIRLIFRMLPTTF
jgi:hypothetical protein